MPTEEQKAKIEKTAQGILDARAKYLGATLGDMYSITGCLRMRCGLSTTVALRC